MDSERFEHEGMVHSLKELEELDIEVRSDRVELVLEKN